MAEHVKPRTRDGGNGYSLEWALPILIAVLYVVGPIYVASAQTAANFDQFFRKVDTIALDDDPLIGMIYFLDVDPKGNMLITDLRSRQVYLFDKDGHHGRALSPEDCDPGLDWSPEKAQFRPDGSIVVRNGQLPWGIVFDSSGECLHVLHEDFEGLKGFCATSNRMFGLHPGGPTEIRLSIFDYDGKRVARVRGLPQKFSHFDFRSDYDGLACVNETAYATLASGPEIYELKGDAVNKIIRYVPSYHRSIDRDVPVTGAPSKLIRAFDELSRTKTQTYSILPLDDSHVIQQLIAPKIRYGIQIIDVTTGALTQSEEIISDQLIRDAGNGRVYLVGQAKRSADGELPNPYITVYEYTGPGK